MIGSTGGDGPESPDVPSRRRRRRPGAPAAATARGSAVGATGAEPPAAEPRTGSAAGIGRAAQRAGDPGPGTAQRRRASSAERGLRDIVGAGSSRVGVDGALRARDVNRPTDDDLAEAERAVIIVRRNWTPPTR